MTDQFTLDVVAQGLDAAAAEMFEVLRKTAMSPIIYEVLDVGTGVIDASGALISSGAGIPSFIGVLDKSVRAIVVKMGETISEGDIFVTNDPNFGGVTHLNDVVVAQPVFSDGRIIAWVASIAHWGDIGGRTAGSMSTETTDIVAEGLRLPIVRLFSKGEINNAVFDIISTNSRLPDFVLGDLWAQVSAGRKAARTIRNLCTRYGRKTLEQSILAARRTGEQRARKGLAKLPKGIFEISEPQDDGSIWTAKIVISKDSFCVDLRDAPPEAEGPHNTGRDGAMVACQVLFKALTDASRFANAGSFAPLEVLTKPGTIFHAGPQAPHAYYFETRIKLVDMLWHCLAKAMPGMLPAGHFGSIFGTAIAGQHADTGRRYTMVEPQMGGWGATPDQPGQHAMFSTSHGDTFNCPTEIAEARYGFEVVEKRLLFAPPSHGQSLGGAGVQTRYKMRKESTLSVGYSHGVTPVWALNDAQEGGTNSMTVENENGSTKIEQFVSGMTLKTGDVVKINTAFGGSALQKTKANVPT